MAWTFPKTKVSKHSTQLAATQSVKIGGHRLPEVDPEQTLTAKEVTDLANQLLRGISKGVSMWCSIAQFQNVTINGSLASAGPGCLTGMSMRAALSTQSEFIHSHVMKKRIADAVLKGVAESFEIWQSQVSIPARPWYPVFSAIPAAVAPPTPNRPHSLESCISPYKYKITSSQEIEFAINEHLPDELGPPLKIFSKKMAVSLSDAFNLWLSISMVTNVLGTGPVPTFRPPTVPVGPVMGGFIIPSPSHFADAARLNPIPVSDMMSGSEVCSPV